MKLFFINTLNQSKLDLLWQFFNKYYWIFLALIKMLKKVSI